MMHKFSFLAVALALVVSACGGNGGALGMGRSLPDETAVVDAPPLTLPPRFELRPPEDGKISEALLRQPAPRAIEADDAWLVEQAGQADPAIREKLQEPVVVDTAPAEMPVEAPAKADDASFWNVWGGWAPSDENDK